MSDKDFKDLGADASTVRRQFKKRFGMTFDTFARARRMGIAMKQIRKGEPVIEAQLTTGYDSSSGLGMPFQELWEQLPPNWEKTIFLKLLGWTLS